MRQTSSYFASADVGATMYSMRLLERKLAVTVILNHTRRNILAKFNATRSAYRNRAFV